MSEHITPPERTVQQDAIDINDFVYAATGARVRRLTMPDGTHWFPAADVLGELGYTNPAKTLADHVPERYRTPLGTLTTRYGSIVPAGHGFKKTMNMINLHGLIRLVGACTKPTSELFKEWVTDVIVTVQRGGSYELESSSIATGGKRPLLLPEPLAEVIVRLEERNLRLDEEFAAAQREAEITRKGRLESQQKMVQTQHESVRLQREALQTQRELLQNQGIMAWLGPCTGSPIHLTRWPDASGPQHPSNGLPRPGSPLRRCSRTGRRGCRSLRTCGRWRW